MTTAVSESSAFQQAFESAKSEHSASAERAAASEASPEAVETDEVPDEAQDPPPAAEGSATTDDDLISDTELQAIKDANGDNPAAVEKALKAAYTRKTQALAQERAAFARYKPLQSVLDDLVNGNEKAAITALAKMHGVALAETAPAAEASTEKPAADTAAIVDDTIQQFRAALGPDLEFLADKLAAPIKAMVEATAKQVAGQEVAPLKQHHEALLSKAAVEQTESIVREFEAKHPGWKKHEPAMLALAQKLQPNGMSEAEYLETLHALVTKDEQIAEASKKAVAKLTKAADKAEPVTHATSDTQVTARPPKSPTFAEAYEAAKRGEKWE